MKKFYFLFFLWASSILAADNNTRQIQNNSAQVQSNHNTIPFFDEKKQEQFLPESFQELLDATQERLAKRQKLIDNTLQDFKKSYSLSIKNTATSHYFPAKNYATTSIQNLDTLAELFQPLLEKLKKIKKQSQNSLQDISKQNQPQKTDNIFKKTKEAIQDSKNAKQENEKATAYIQEAKEFQELKKNALSQNNWAKAQDLENRNINAIQKAIKELEKNQAASQNSKGKPQDDNQKEQESKNAGDKLSQIQKYQEQLKEDRQKIFGKKKNEVQKVPIDKDW